MFNHWANKIAKKANIKNIERERLTDNQLILFYIIGYFLGHFFVCLGIWALLNIALFPLNLQLPFQTAIGLYLVYILIGKVWKN